MSIFKIRQNKRYSYEPRYYKSEGKTPFKIERKFDEYRSTIDTSGGLKGKFMRALNDYKYNQDKTTNKRILIISLVLLFLFFALLGFDLSIFTKN